jgi:hypothetical protein
MTPTEREALLFLLRYAASLAGGPPAVGSVTQIEQLIREIEAEGKP